MPTQETVKCPYPDCPSRRKLENPVLQVFHLADEVYLCHACGRLSALCLEGHCDALNRPYSLFCRKCGTTQTSINNPRYTQSRWQQAEQFDYDWTFPVDESENETHEDWEVTAAATSKVMSLTSLSGLKTSDHLMEWSIIDGVVAVHQPGGAMLLMHPFGEHLQPGRLSSDNRPIPPERKEAIWIKSEQDVFRSSGMNYPYISDDAQILRPWTPTATWNRKYLVFSAPYFLMSLELGSVQGWSSHNVSHEQIIEIWDSPESYLLAAAPVPLPPDPVSDAKGNIASNGINGDRIGLTTYRTLDKKYYWKTLTLGQSSTEPPINGEAIEPKVAEIPVTGYPLEVLQLQPFLLIFSTPEGHWLWSIQDAVASNTKSITKLNTISPSERNSSIDVSLYVRNRGFFKWPRQHVYPLHMHHGQRREIPEFELAYVKKGPSTAEVEVLRLPVLGANQQLQPRPMPLGTPDRASPLGMWTRDAHDDVRELVVIFGGHAELYYRRYASNDLIPLFNLQLGDASQILSLQLQDPLLIEVRYETPEAASQPARNRQDRFRIDIRSLSHTERSMLVRSVVLKAQPLVWSNFLLTLERNDDGEIAVWRREFAIASVGTNSHLNNRPPLSRRETQ